MDEDAAFSLDPVESWENLEECGILDDAMMIDAIKNVWNRDFKFCDCGQPWKGLRAVHHVLNKRKDIDHLEPIHEDDGELFIACFLSSVGYLEHGGSVLGAWITPSGKSFIWLIEKLLERHQWDEIRWESD